MRVREQGYPVCYEGPSQQGDACMVCVRGVMCGLLVEEHAPNGLESLGPCAGLARRGHA